MLLVLGFEIEHLFAADQRRTNTFGFIDVFVRTPFNIADVSLADEGLVHRVTLTVRNCQKLIV